MEGYRSLINKHSPIHRIHYILTTNNHPPFFHPSIFQSPFFFNRIQIKSTRHCMAISCLETQISELCLGKPAIRPVVTTVTSVKDALTALKRSGDSYLSVWRFRTRGKEKINEGDGYVCVGRFCVADVICFLCKEGNLGNPLESLEAPVSDILDEVYGGIVEHMDMNSSLLEAIDCILEGTQNLVIPIQGHTISKSGRKLLNDPSLQGFSLHDSSEYCWLTQEDIVRFLLNSIGVFSPIPTFTIESLNIMSHDIMTIHYNDPASLVLPCIPRAITEQTSVAVIDDEKRLIGEISPNSLGYSDETVAAAIMTLSAGDFMAYTDCAGRGPPEDLVQLVKMRLEEKGLTAMLQLVDELSVSSISSSSSSFSSYSSDDDVSSGLLSRNSSCSGLYSSVVRSEAIMCYPRSSLIAVMVQALAHRVSHVWVVDEDQTLVGIVTFQRILEVLRSITGEQSKNCKGNLFKQ